MITLILIGFIAAAAYSVSVLRWPMAPCRRCKGTGANKGSNRKRSGICKACSGAKMRQRFGATTVHRYWWSVAGGALHERRKKRAKEAREKAGYPEL